MKPLFSAKSITGERRRHERVEVSYTAQVHVTDDKGKRVGVLRQLSRGGFMIEPEREFKEGKKLKLEFECRQPTVKSKAPEYVAYRDTMALTLSMLEREVVFKAVSR